MSISVSGSQITFNDSSTQTTSPFTGGLGFRNRIINGAFMIDQRNAGASKSYSAGTLAYTVDRFYILPSGAAVTAQQVSSGVTGIANVMQITGAASVTGVVFGQRIESKNCGDLAGQTVTVSVQFANSLLTTVNWGIYYASATDNFASTPTIATGSFTVNSTLTTYSFTVTLPSGAANGIELDFTVGAQTSGTWKIGQVQLEKGSTATSFDYRPYGTELQLCQRYYFKELSQTADQGFCSGVFYSATNAQPIYKYPITMRSSPTISIYNCKIQSGSTASGSTSSLSLTRAGLNTVQMDITVSGFTAGYSLWLKDDGSNTGYVSGSAEL